MKKIFATFILGIALAGVSFAQADKSSKPRIAVIEFSTGPDASSMTVEAKRHLQASIAFSLYETRKFDVPDVRNTRAATQASLPAINGEGSTSTAVRIGKLLGVNYVLTGTVTEYNKEMGRGTIRTRLIEVATGKVKYAGELTHQSATPMSARAGEAEMMLKVLKPSIERLTAELAAQR
jgi:hypothetical protein